MPVYRRGTEYDIKIYTAVCDRFACGGDSICLGNCRGQQKDLYNHHMVFKIVVVVKVNDPEHKK